MPPFTVNLFRFAASTATLGGLWAWRARSLGEPFFGILRQNPGAILGLGLLGHVGYQVLFILGIARTGAGSAALIIASAPAWTALIGHVTGIERLRPVQWAGLAVSTAGVGLVVLYGDKTLDFSAEALTGNLLLLVGAIFWALYTVLCRPVLARGMAPLGLTFFSVLAAMPVLALLGVLSFPATDWAGTDAVDWTAILYSGALSTGVAYLLWNLAVRKVGPSQTATFANLVPFVALVAAVFILGDAITLPQVGGGVLIVGGVVAMRRF